MNDIEIMREYKNVPRHCGSPTEIKFMFYDGGWGDTGAMLFFQCKVCGIVIRARIDDSLRKYS